MTAIDKAIAFFGSKSAMARAVGVSDQAIRFWETGERRPDIVSCIKIEKATAGSVRCESLRDDIDWPYLRQPMPVEISEKAAT
jgi:DNA-binding transcriptional regulator YdaS (Cro superfamily)